jgi:hypothetical protein
MRRSNAGEVVNQLNWRLAAAILSSFLVGGCASTTSTIAGVSAPGSRTPATGVPASATPTARRATASPTVSILSTPPCRARSLALRYGPQISPATGEHGDIYVLANRGPSACTLAGYPRITLYTSDGTRLPFHYVHGHSQYVTSAPPRPVVLRPGGSAYVLVAKFRCDLGVAQAAATIRITIPSPQHGAVTGRAASNTSGVSALTYCRGGPNGPGQIIAVSPIEPTRLATTPG